MLLVLVIVATTVASAFTYYVFVANDMWSNPDDVFRGGWMIAIAWFGVVLAFLGWMAQ